MFNVSHDERRHLLRLDLAGRAFAGGGLHEKGLVLREDDERDPRHPEHTAARNMAMRYMARRAGRIR